MKDDGVRRNIKRAGLWIYDLRLWLHRRAADVRYELGGDCARCAQCCERPGIQLSKLTWHVPLLRKVFLAWHRLVNGFELVSEVRAERALFFNCTHFDRETKSCDSYETRPGMCRDYPRLFLEQANPEFLEGCGYKAVASNRSELVQILQAQSLTEAQMKKLTKGLYLDD